MIREESRKERKKTYHACRRVERICRPRPCSGQGRRSLTRALRRSCAGKDEGKGLREEETISQALEGTDGVKAGRAVVVGRRGWSSSPLLVLVPLAGQEGAITATPRSTEGWEKNSFSGFVWSCLCRASVCRIKIGSRAVFGGYH